MEDQKYLILINRYLSNQLSLNEIDELLSWLTADKDREELFGELGEAWNRIRNYPENFTVDTKEGWKRLKSAIAVFEQANQPKNQNFWNSFRQTLNNLKSRSLSSIF
jgi:dihydroorotase